jgi:hypothetical protein
MAAANSIDFLTPVMRLVQGDPLTAQTKDLKTGLPLTIKTGPNAGQPTQKFFCALAGKKGDVEVETFKRLYEDLARKAFPQFFPNGGPCTNPNFSYKIVDGDGYDDNGQPNNLKEGFAGNWVFRFASSYAPQAWVRGKYNPASDQITDPKVFPRGHFVRVSGTLTDNIPSNKPGLYANLGMIEWNSIGPLIISGPVAASVFGGGAGAPAAAGGFTMTALAGTFTREQYLAAGHTDETLLRDGFMVRNATPAAPAPAPQPAAPAPAPMAPAPMVPAPAPAQPFTMTALAGAFTREQYLAAGHTDESLIAGGMMVRNVAAAPAPAPQPAAPAPVPVQPHAGILSPAAPAPLAPAGSAPAPAPPAQIAVAAPGFKMADPMGPTYASYLAANWTDAMLIQNGHMVPA